MATIQEQFSNYLISQKQAEIVGWIENRKVFKIRRKMEEWIGQPEADVYVIVGSYGAVRFVYSWNEVLEVVEQSHTQKQKWWQTKFIADMKAWCYDPENKCV
jgi:hypothetical protein